MGEGDVSPSLQPRLSSANAVCHARLRTGTSIFLQKMNLRRVFRYLLERASDASPQRLAWKSRSEMRIIFAVDFLRFKN